MISNSVTLGLFPVPVHYVFDTEYKIKQSEIDYINTLETLSNRKNNLSTNTSILENENLSEIKNLCIEHLNHYIKDVCKIKQNFLIINSWITKNNRSESHHQHKHQNSIFSGVFYINAGPKMGNINFHYKPAILDAFDFAYDFEEFNLYNGSSWWLEVKTGSLVIFPSWLQHSVDENLTDDCRICLGFNTFVDDYFGNGITWKSKSGTSTM